MDYKANKIKIKRGCLAYNQIFFFLLYCRERQNHVSATLDIFIGNPNRLVKVTILKLQNKTFID